MAFGRLEVGVGVLLGAIEKEEAGRGDAEEWESAIVVDELAAEDTERCLSARSAFCCCCRRSWLLDERWPGVWERGIGGARSSMGPAS